MQLERHTIEKGKVRQTSTYAITSLSHDSANAAVLLKHLRGRWLIESRFYVLDVHLRQDHCRVRTCHTAFVLSSVRHMAINLQRIPSYLVEIIALKDHAKNENAA